MKKTQKHKKNTRKKPAKKIRILLLNYEYPPIGGGAGPVSHDIAKGLKDLGHKVDVITMHYKDLKRHEKKDGIDIYRVGISRKKKEFCSVAEMKMFITPALKKAIELHKKNRYDICHTHFVIPTGIIAYLLKKVTGLDYILTAHGSDIPDHNTDRFTLLHRFTRPLIRTIAKNAKKVISPSNYLRALMKKTISKDIKVIPNGLDLEEYSKQKKTKRTSSKKNIIFSAGRMHRMKGFHHLIEAVKDKDIGWEVHIAGDGPYLKKLKHLAKGSKTKIVFYGWISKQKMKNLYARSKIFALLSQVENASIVLLEAMALGCAILTTDAKGCKETVGSCAEIVRYGDISQIKKKLNKLMTKNAIYRKKSLKRAKDFDIKKIVRLYEDELKR